MKILLVSPSYPRDELFAASAPPLGLLYLATAARNLGHHVRIIDQAAVGMSNEEIINRVKKWDPEVAGFSVLCESFGNARFISEQLKSWNPNIRIVFGNYLPTFYAKKMLENYKCLDVCVRGEGDETFIDLLDAWEKNRPLEEVAGISYTLNGSIKENKDRPLIKNLDKLPIPDRTFVPDIYKNRIYGIDVSKYKFTTMVSSKGCPYACRFCSCRTFTNGTFRARSVNNVLAEICQLADQGYQEIFFVDDNFTLNKKRVIELSQKIQKEKLDLRFTTFGRVNHSTYELYRQMKLAGVNVIMFGFESGVQRILDSYNKRITLEMSRIAVKLARKAGLDMVTGAFLLGGYDETYEEALQTIKFISTLDIDFPQIVITRALPGTPIFNELVRKKILDEEMYWETGVNIIDLPGAKMNRKGIFRLVNYHFPKIFLNSKYIARAFLRNFTSRYRREIFLSHLNRKDIMRVGQLMKNPLDFI